MVTSQRSPVLYLGCYIIGSGRVRTTRFTAHASMPKASSLAYGMQSSDSVADDDEVEQLDKLSISSAPKLNSDTSRDKIIRQPDNPEYPQ